MKKFKGFKWFKKIVSIASRNRATKYTPLDSSLSLQPKSKLPCHKIVKIMSKLFEFVSFFARVIPMSYSFRVQDQPPKGYLAVYVDERGEDGEQSQLQRYVMPITHLNHPVFVDLLREAEEEFEFKYHRGIIIPCPKIRFENVIKLIGCTAVAVGTVGETHLD